jgi:hypothetical protein
MEKPIDLERDELLKFADDTLKDFAKSGVTAIVYFKFTCEHCGERCTFDEPNLLFENGECHACGKMTVIKKGGFMVSLPLDDKVDA